MAPKVITENPAALRDLSPICGKSERLRNHLRKCPLVPPEIQAEVLPRTDMDKENAPPGASDEAGPNNSQTHPSKKLKMSHISSAFTFTSTAEHQRTFSEDLCKLLVSCSISWNALSNPGMKLFMDPRCCSAGSAYYIRASFGQQGK